MIDIEYLDSLPFRESHSKGIIRKYGSLYNVAKWEGWRHRENHKYPWTLAIDVLKRFVGCSYDEAFSYYCKKLKELGLNDRDDKRYFDKEITELCYWRIHRHHKNYQYFRIDEDDIIHWDLRYFDQLKEYSRRRFPQTLPVLNGHYEVTEFQLIDWWNPYYLKKTINLTEYLGLSDWHKRKYAPYKTIREYITFDSKNDRAYKRYKQEERKFHKKLKRQEIKEKSQIEYCFLTDSEKKKIKDRETDLIKRDSHGFDDESFKGEHYHGQKRKKKEVINAFENLNQLII